MKRWRFAKDIAVDRDDGLIAVGQMSGTSLDGIDIAIIEATPKRLKKRIAALFYPYPDAVRDELTKLIQRFQEGARPSTQTITAQLTDLNIEAIRKTMGEAGLTSNQIDVIGYHGQTVWHDPQEGLTVQLGNAARLANAVRIDVIHDFRSNDMYQGGQGAPLTPLYHKALFSELAQPTAVVNIGGISNLTYIEDDTLIAFDCGPGNALIDDAMRNFGLGSYDADGAIAATGTPCAHWLDEFLANPYFTATYPKSLDRLQFQADFEALLARQLSVEDTLASATMATAIAIKAAVALLPKPPQHWVLCGGGRHNGTLVQYMANALNASMYDSDIYGLNGDTLEAEAFGYLAIRSLKGEYLTLPSTTGCRVASIGGVLVGA